MLAIGAHADASTPQAERRATVSRRAMLRAATAAAHEACEQAADHAAFFATRDRYGDFIRRLYRFHTAYEAAMAAPVASDALARWNWTPPPRAALLARDVKGLGVPAIAAEVSLRVCERHPLASGLGAAYVAEGSALGARVLVKRAAMLGVDEHNGAAFLGSAARDRTTWPQFLALLDAAPLDPAGEAAMRDAAIAAFVAVLSALTTEDCP